MRKNNSQLLYNRQSSQQTHVKNFGSSAPHGASGELLFPQCDLTKTQKNATSHNTKEHFTVNACEPVIPCPSLRLPSTTWRCMRTHASTGIYSNRFRIRIKQRNVTAICRSRRNCFCLFYRRQESDVGVGTERSDHISGR